MDEQFEEQLLEGIELDLVGFQAIELCNQFTKRLDKLINKYQQLLIERGDGPGSYEEKVAESSGGSPWSTSNLLKELDDLSKWCVETLSGVVDLMIPSSSDIATIDLGRFLEQSFGYYQRACGREANIDIRVQAIGTKRTKGDGEKSGDSVSVESSPVEVARLYVYLLAYLSGLEQGDDAARISLSYETIGSGTATLVPGYFPGDYGRIVIFHPGQTLAGHIMSGAPSSGNPFESDTSVNPALQLMKLQANRIGGRVSVQSSFSEGTTISIYIPAVWLVEEDMPASIRNAFVDPKRSGLQLPGGTRKPVLLIGTEPEKLAELERMIKFLGYPLSVKSSTELLNALSGEEAGQESSSISDIAKMDETNIVILNLEDEDAPGQALAERIETQLPYETLLVITEDNPDEVAGPEETFVLSKPYDIIGLKRALENMLTSGA